MRKNRSNMVQMEAQYVFIHQCMVQALRQLELNEPVYQNQNYGEEQENMYVNQGFEAEADVDEGIIDPDVLA